MPLFITDLNSNDINRLRRDLGNDLSGTWSQCSKTCGGGVQWMMSVVNGEQVNSTRTCNTNMCPGRSWIRVSEMPSLNYTSKSDCLSPKAVW